jgi:predicted phosphodiesterase
LRVALFSDVHGNLRGLEACLADLTEQGGADLIVGAGDYCMDGPRPREVLERIHEIGAVCVRGNTDRWIGDESIAVDGGEDDEELAQLAWQRAQLGLPWTRWLGALPFSHRLGEGADGLLVVHANPKSDDEHIWPDADDAFLEQVTAGVAERAIAFGHLHLPYARVWRERLLVDVSSAGLPKDGDARAGYAILTQRSGGWEVKHRRVAFDVDEVVKEIEKSEMPGRKKCISVLRRHRYKELNGPIP